MFGATPQTDKTSSFCIFIFEVQKPEEKKTERKKKRRKKEEEKEEKQLETPSRRECRNPIERLRRRREADDKKKKKREIFRVFFSRE